MNTDHQPAWRKSSRSSGNGECVEIANDGRHSAARDSKNPHGPVLELTPAALQTFLRRGPNLRPVTTLSIR
ncbi:DUF397 domain-containing protein [Actinophytocola sediminis]